MAKTLGELKDRISSSLDRTLEELWEVLNLFAQGGGTQEDALAVLEQLRVETENAIKEDRLLELMDFATGFCAPNRALWRDDSTTGV